MSGIFEDEINTWVQAVSSMHSNVARETFDEQAARDNVYTLWSGFGFRDAPDAVLTMLEQAIQIGYIAALRDVREGRFDDQVRTWRSFY